MQCTTQIIFYLYIHNLTSINTTRVPMELFLANEDNTLQFGQHIAKQFTAGGIIYLTGDLGAGKTTFVRGFLKAFNHYGPVRSPTYTLVEPYQFEEQEIYHFDLYRLGDPEELEYAGCRDYFHKNALCLIEWPEKAYGYLPSADLSINLSYHSKGRLASY